MGVHGYFHFSYITLQVCPGILLHGDLMIDSFVLSFPDVRQVVFDFFFGVKNTF